MSTRNEWLFEVSAEELVKAVEQQIARHERELEFLRTHSVYQPDTDEDYELAALASAQHRKLSEYRHWIAILQRDMARTYSLDCEDLRYFGVGIADAPIATLEAETREMVQAAMRKNPVILRRPRVIGYDLQ